MSQQSRDQFVPSGVNAQSWLGFEQRIQERRFRALLDTMEQAIAAHDAVKARVAFEEARELRPGAPELADMEERLALLPVAIARADNQAAWSRALGAVMMLLVGVSLLIGIDWLRAGAGMTTVTPVVASPDLRIATPTFTSDEAPAVTIVPPPAVEDLVPARPKEVGTSGVEQRIRGALGSARVRAATVVSDAVPPLTPAEIPDDFVFVPPTPRLAPDAASRVVASAERPPAPAASPVAAPAATIAPQQDQTRVAAVLNQYARAYGRLDAVAAREVWPSVDQRALARAFDDLAAQSVAFDDCSIDVHGATANASCRGRASYVGKVGSREPRTEPRTWRFELRRDGEAWKIENAEARRQ